MIDMEGILLDTRVVEALKRLEPKEIKMDTKTGEIFMGTQEDMNKLASERDLVQLTQAEALAKINQQDRPIELAFDKYLKSKKRWAHRTQREAFEAGYKAALANNGVAKV